jgi:two-component system, probable response regulator PhcQ
MQELYDYKKFGILYVDDEEKSLKYFTRAFSEKFRIFTAKDATEGFKIFEDNKDEIAIFLTDQRMPGEKGVQLLERVRSIRPSVIRILVTAYTDAEVAIDAVNSGAIYKYVSKPWDIPELGVTLRRAVEFFLIQRERDHLLREKLCALEKLVVVDRILGLALLTSGIRSELKNSLGAVHSFLNAKPLETGLDERNLEELKSHSRWRQVYAHTQDHLGQLAERIRSIPVNSVSGKADLAKVFSDELEKRAQFLADGRIDIENGLAEEVIPLEGQIDVIAKIAELTVESMIAGLLPRGGLSISRQASEADDGAIVLKILRRGIRLGHASFQSVFDPFTISDEATESQGLKLLTLYLLVFHLGGSIQFEDLGDDSTELVLTLPRSADVEEENWEQSLLDNLLNENVWELLTSR